MDIKSIREKYFRENPQAVAAFVYNERLKSVVCYEYHSKSASPDVLISETQVREIAAHAAKNNTTPLNAVIEYFYSTTSDDRLLDKIGNYYIECMQNETTFQTIEEACAAFNANVKIDQNPSKSPRKLITAKIINELGEFEDFNIHV